MFCFRRRLQQKWIKVYEYEDYEGGNWQAAASCEESGKNWVITQPDPATHLGRKFGRGISYNAIRPVYRKVWKIMFCNIPLAVGRYCSYLLPKQALATCSKNCNKILRLTGRILVYITNNVEFHKFFSKRSLINENMHTLFRGPIWGCLPCILWADFNVKICYYIAILEQDHGNNAPSSRLYWALFFAIKAIAQAST